MIIALIFCFYVVGLLFVGVLFSYILIPIGLVGLFVGFLLGRICAIIKSHITKKPIKK